MSTEAKEVKKHPPVPKDCRCLSCGGKVTENNLGVWTRTRQSGTVYLCDDCAREEGLIK